MLGKTYGNHAHAPIECHTFRQTMLKIQLKINKSMRRMNPILLDWQPKHTAHVRVATAFVQTVPVGSRYMAICVHIMVLKTGPWNTMGLEKKTRSIQQKWNQNVPKSKPKNMVHSVIWYANRHAEIHLATHALYWS